MAVSFAATKVGRKVIPTLSLRGLTIFMFLVLKSLLISP